MMLIVSEIFIEIKILNIAQIPKKGTKNSKNQKYPTIKDKKPSTKVIGQTHNSRTTKTTIKSSYDK